MVVSNYFYRASSEVLEDRVAIPELVREDYMTPQYFDMFEKELGSLELSGRVGLVYSSGASIHQAENRICHKENYSNSLDRALPSPLVAKSMVAHMMHKYIAYFTRRGVDIQAADIVSNTCASSLYGVVRASTMLKEVDHVIVITEEKTSFDTIRIFDEHRIKVKASDGFALAVFSNEGEGPYITDCKTTFRYNSNPFLATADGYRDLISPCDIVKVHGTGTEMNTLAENEAFEGMPQIEYKSLIGHSQGSSGLLELCMSMDDNRTEGLRTLCIASGFGGFYASCVLHRQ